MKNLENVKTSLKQKEGYDIDLVESVEDKKNRYGDIINTFYGEIVPEASKGSIDAWFRRNLLFSTSIGGIRLTRVNRRKNPELCITNLSITNKEEFDRLLCEYVDMAINFYNDGDLEEKLEDAPLEDHDRYLYKYIISSLFANASDYDFANPIEFLNRRIEMFNNRLLDKEKELYLSSIGATIKFSEKKAPIETETPYYISSELIFDDGYKMPLPNVYEGVSGDKMFIYGVISKTRSIDIDESHLKEIRKGYTARIKGAPEHYFLSDMLSLSLSDGMETVVVPFLPQRWNAKRTAILNSNLSEEGRRVQKNKQELIQINLTNILARYYSKLEAISDSLNYTSFPFECDDKIHLRIDSNKTSQCPVFNELVEYNKSDSKIRRRK